MGKILNKRLLELGGKPFHETGYADDGVGYVMREREREGSEEKDGGYACNVIVIYV